MTINETNIAGLYIIKNNVFDDDRGLFHKPFSYSAFSEYGLQYDFKEFYYSISKKNVIRGMHFQSPPQAHTKLVYVTHGAILDIVLDIRAKSGTFGSFYMKELNSIDGESLYIPIGMAHGFLSLEDETIVNYAQTSGYAKNYDKGIRFDSFGFDWQVSDPIVSNRDEKFPLFKDYQSEFS